MPEVDLYTMPEVVLKIQCLVFKLMPVAYNVYSIRIKGFCIYGCWGDMPTCPFVLYQQTNALKCQQTNALKCQQTKKWVFFVA